MARKVELMGFGLACAGWLCAILTWFLPMWSVSALNSTAATLPMYWDGVWLNWDQRDAGSLHCTLYQSLLHMSGSFRAWRALIMASIGAGAFSAVLYAVGAVKFPQRAQVTVAAGVAFVLSGALLLVAVSWTSHSTAGTLDAPVTITRDWGAALYTGWMATALLMAGGGVLSTKCCTAAEQQAQTRRGPETGPGAEDPLFTIHIAAVRRTEPVSYIFKANLKGSDLSQGWI